MDGQGDAMKNTRLSALSILLTLAALPAAHADDKPAAPESRNEIVVFGGASLLDASGSTHSEILPGGRTFSFAGFDLGRLGAFGRNTNPFPVPPVSISSESEMGSSVLFGARYSRFIKDRLALEADLMVAPGHEASARLGGCVGDLCFGPGSGRGGDDRGIPGFDGGFGRLFGERNVTAWHYGAGLAYELTGGEVRPVLILGAGAVTWDGAREAGTDFVFRFGAGLKIFFGHVGARVDVVDHLVIDQFLTNDTEHDVHTTAGLLVRF
jgi:hypothetical protein